MATKQPAPAVVPRDGVRPQPPVMALRTYTALRLGSVGVIALLGVAIFREVYWGTPDNCLQGSISAYYYTPVQSVFVGTLLALGLVMIVLWGKTPFEDGFLNLAGLLAPVVAFVPTADADRCGITDASGNLVDSTKAKERIIDADHAAIINNMTAYFVVVAIALLILLAIGIIAYLARWESITKHQLAYWGPWGLALGLWIFGATKFWGDREWIYEDAHNWAASVMFVFIGVVVIIISYHKRGETQHAGLPFYKKKPGALAYATIAAFMVVGVVLFRVFPDVLPAQFDDHHTFWLEAWEISLLACFWLFQTRDRLNEGAPPRTDAEVARTGI